MGRSSESGGGGTMVAHLKGAILFQYCYSVVLALKCVCSVVFLCADSLDLLMNAASPVSLIIHTPVREDNITLFGFLSPREKQLFLRLISVSGIGPKLAINILSGIPSEELIEATHREDLVRLTAIPGIGKKT